MGKQGSSFDGMKDIAWINTAKGICMLSVFFVHVQLYYGCSTEGLNSIIYTFYVNGFFFISGYLLFWKQLTPPIIDQTKSFYWSANGAGRKLASNILYRIIIPSIFFSVIEFVPACMAHDRGISIDFFLLKTVGGGTMWFTSALVVAEIVLLMLLCTRRRSIFFYFFSSLCVTAVAYVAIRNEYINGDIWFYRQGLLAVFFLALGGFYWRYETLIDRAMKIWIVLPLAVCFVYLVYAIPGISNPLISTLTIRPLGFLTGAISCMLLIWVCKRLPEINPLVYIGKNSLGFYFLCGGLPIIASFIVHRILSAQNTIVMIGVWLACVIVAYLIVLAINKWIPWIWDLRVLKHKKQI